MRSDTEQLSSSARLLTASSSQAPTHICPTCGGAELRRSHRRGVIERYVLGLFGFRPFRCEGCHARFYAGWSLSNELTDDKSGANFAIEK